MDLDLGGRVIIVTGAGNGIGRTTARMLAGMGAVAIVADIDLEAARKTVQAIADAGGRATAHKIDVTREADWHLLLGEVRDHHGRLDALVNAAGVLRGKPFMHATVQELDESMLINVNSVFMGCRLASELMIETHERYDTYPSIVNISSIYGIFAGLAHVVYSATKGAVRMMSKGMAQELAKHRIRVNTVFPGPTNTALLTQAVAKTIEYGLRPASFDTHRDMAAAHPMGRMAEPEDVASVIAFLCCDGARFMTGGELIVDGGLTLM